MQVSKAVITAAGRGARQYPASDTVQKAMSPLVDRDGLTKPVLHIIAEEALGSGIEQICVVVAPGDEAAYRDQFRAYANNLRAAYRDAKWADDQARRLLELEQRLTFAVQAEPKGYGHAVWRAREFVGEYLIDHAMTFDPALSIERLRHNIHPEVGFAAGPMAGVALMQM